MNDDLSTSASLRRLSKKDGVEVNVRNVIAQLLGSDLLSIKGGGTILHAETALGNHETCYLLLHRAAQLGYRKELLITKNVDDRTALQVACERGHLDVVRLLLDMGSPMAPSPEHPFQLAYKGGHREICALFVDRRNDVRANAVEAAVDVSFLREAVLVGDVDLAEMLISRSLEPELNLPSMHGSCLDAACIRDDFAMVALLVKHDAQIHISTMKVACRYGSVELVRFLKSHASDEVINATNSYRLSPLEVACKYNRLSVVRVLITEGKKVRVSHEALKLACENGNQAIAKVLLEVDDNQYFTVDDAMDPITLDVSMLTYIMALAELSKDDLPIRSFTQPESCGYSFRQACLDLDIADQINDEMVVENTIRYSQGEKVVSGQPSNFTLCLNSGIDIVSRLWHYWTENYGKDTYHISDDLMLAFIEMGAVDSCHAPANIGDIVFPKGSSTRSCQLLGALFVTYINNKIYDMVEKMVNACPSIFHQHLYCPENLDSDFIDNVVIRCNFDVNSAINSSGRTILMEVCGSLLVEGVQMMLAAGANVNKMDDSKSICLHYLADAVLEVKSEAHPLRAETVEKAKRIIILLTNAGVDVTMQDEFYEERLTAKQVLERYNFPDLAAML